NSICWEVHQKALDIIDGIDLEALVAKRTAGMMQPQVAEKIAKVTRKEFPDGLNAYGTDALRFTFLSLASTGRDIKFDVGRIEGFRNFCNKIWNASRYVLMNCEEQNCGQDGTTDYELSLADRWIISRLQQAEKSVAEAIAQYRFDLATQAVYEFFWNEYCDWYLELSKPVLNDTHATAAQKTGTRRTLIRVLEASLRLMHPMMPFITEEIWQRVKALAGAAGDSIMLAHYPQFDAQKTDVQAETDIAWLQQVILGIRNIRGEMNIPPGKPLPVLLRNGNDDDRTRLAAYPLFLMKLANIACIDWLTADATAPLAATALVGALEILIPMSDLIDKNAELARLQKEIDKLQKDCERQQGKLSNDSFVAKAPPDVIAKEREKLADNERALQKLREQQDAIRVL
ncbi:MAG TPA: class I tRNA ligase family protein, partial [Pseudomonadales bacterium]|nr:class I tRNA ligase family protein [Pseudomonadales bacterium]